LETPKRRVGDEILDIGTFALGFCAGFIIATILLFFSLSKEGRK